MRVTVSVWFEITVDVIVASYIDAYVGTITILFKTVIGNIKNNYGSHESGSVPTKDMYTHHPQK